LIESFNKVSNQLSVRGSNGELCHIEEEGEHHDEEHHEEEEGHHEEEHHEDDHNMTNTTDSCNVMYDLCKNVIITLNLTTNECLESHGHAHGNGTSGISSAQAYGYGFLMIVLVSLCSLIGVLLVPLLSSNSVIGKQTYEYVYALMIAVGISALICDAVLHLIPHGLGLHAHGHGEDGHDDHSSEEEGTPDYIWKGCFILLGIYFFYLLEIIIHGIGDYLSKRSKTTSHKHSFSNGRSTDDGNYSSELPTVKSDQSPENIELSAEKPSSSPNETGANGHVENNDKAEVHEVKKPFYLRIEPVAWLIIFGDAFHNFADGLALGGAIAQSLTLGVSTMFALIFHEVPHELGQLYNIPL
jgi:zinc transporter ZupT